MRLLFIGGCKSGKSSTAQRMARALACGKPMYYWATMEPHDGEDLARIRRHCADREGWGFTTNPGREIGDFTGDCGFQDSASVVTGALGEGRFVLFFPTELHKPGLVQHGCVGVRKAVVKIRMED